MSTLSHITKVKVCKALVALCQSDRMANSYDPITHTMGASEFVAQTYLDSVQRTVLKAGFRNRADLEAFAKKHHLL